MEIRFKKKYLEELYRKGKTSDKKHRFQPQIIARYKRTVDLMASLSAEEDMYRFKSLNYEALCGDKSGVSSVRVNDKYRIEFTIEKISAEVVITVCNILELSNHYK